MYADNNKRTPDNSINRNQERRSVSQQTQGKTLSRESSATTRRSTNTSMDKSVYKPEKNAGSNSSRRTLNNYTKKTASGSGQSRYGSNSGNSTSNASYRTVERREQANNAGTSRRSPVTISEKAASRPQQVQKAQSSGSPKQPTIKAGSSDRRSSKLSKTGTAVASRDNAKGSAEDKTSRRR